MSTGATGCSPTPRPPPSSRSVPRHTLNLGDRAFEIVLARRVQAGEAETQWFARHGSTPITELPSHWPHPYQRTVQARIDLIEKRRDPALIERPECKRRWPKPGRSSRNVPCATGCSTGSGPPTRCNARTPTLSEIVGALVDNGHVPFHAAYRYKPAGLATRSQWEHTWNLQRQEDAIAARLGQTSPTPRFAPPSPSPSPSPSARCRVPPKYGSGDFVKTSYWAQRGKLDVPQGAVRLLPGREPRR